MAFTLLCTWLLSLTISLGDCLLSQYGESFSGFSGWMVLQLCVHIEFTEPVPPEGHSDNGQSFYLNSIRRAAVCHILYYTALPACAKSSLEWILRVGLLSKRDVSFPCPHLAKLPTWHCACWHAGNVLPKSFPDPSPQAQGLIQYLDHAFPPVKMTPRYNYSWVLALWATPEFAHDVQGTHSSEVAGWGFWWPGV